LGVQRTLLPCWREYTKSHLPSKVGKFQQLSRSLLGGEAPGPTGVMLRARKGVWWQQRALFVQEWQPKSVSSLLQKTSKGRELIEKNK
jgi:hypothetical protein